MSNSSRYSKLYSEYSGEFSSRNQYELLLYANLYEACKTISFPNIKKSLNPWNLRYWESALDSAVLIILRFVVQYPLMATKEPDRDTRSCFEVYTKPPDRKLTAVGHHKPYRKNVDCRLIVAKYRVLFEVEKKCLR